MSNEISQQQDWCDRLRFHLALSEHFEKEQITELISEVECYCADSGQQPEEAFGDPSEYAEELVRERVPEAERLRVANEDDQLRYAPMVGGVLVGLKLIVVSVVLLLRTDWVVEITLAGLAGTAVLGVTLMVLSVLRAVWKAGRTHIGAALGTVVGLLVFLAAGFFTQLPRTVLGEVWSIAPALLGFGFIGAAVGTGALLRQRERRTFVEPEGIDEWFGRLRGLLVGRHDLAPVVARKLVDEAKAHLRSSESTHPSAEFGPLEQYALRLAENAEHRPPWWRRREIFTTGGAVLFLTMFVTGLFEDHFDWPALGLWILCTIDAVQGWRARGIQQS